MKRWLWLLGMIFWVALPVGASVQTQYPFADPGRAETFQTLINELRCLVCQNQNLADSHAPLAQDLRQQVYEQLQAGRSPEQIRDYLVQRYGDFILYDPPWQLNTLILWLAPLVLLFLGMASIVYRVKRPKPKVAPLSPAEQAKLHQELQHFKPMDTDSQ